MSINNKEQTRNNNLVNIVDRNTKIIYLKQKNNLKKFISKLMNIYMHCLKNITIKSIKNVHYWG